MEGTPRQQAPRYHPYSNDRMSKDENYTVIVKNPMDINVPVLQDSTDTEKLFNREIQVKVVTLV